jgi:hypothetical protein
MDFPAEEYEPVLIVDVESGRTLTPFCYRTLTRAAARRGLLGRSGLGQGQALLLKDGLVHMVGMRFPLDLVFLDRRSRVVKVCYGVRPGPRLKGSLRARHTLEMAVGEAERAGFCEGQRLSVRTSA